jgi:hypothetical protein
LITASSVPPPRSGAQHALDIAVESLIEAERDRADERQITRLCDEVITRRLRYQLCLLSTERPIPAALLHQMARDRELLRQTAGSLDRW